MSTSVKRYNGIEADPEGVYVMFEDFEALQARVAKLTAERTNLRAVMQVAAPHALAILDKAALGVYKS